MRHIKRSGEIDRGLLSQGQRRGRWQVNRLPRNGEQRADKDAEAAYRHPGTPEYREEYVSQLNSLYGSTIEGKVVVHEIGATVLWHLQVS